MQFIKLIKEKITLKKSLIIFLALSAFNLVVSLLFFYFVSFPQFKNEATSIASYIVKNIEEKNITLKVTKDTIEPNPSEIIFESKDFPINFGKQNLLYVSKEADYADFNEKDTLAILNSKELVINLNNEFQKYPIADFVQNQEIYIDSNNTKEYIKGLEIEGDRFRNTLLGVYGFERIIFYLSQLAWGYVILALAVFYLLKLSGYKPEQEFVRILSILFYSLFMIFEPLTTFFRVNLNFLHLFALGFLIVAFISKKHLDN